MPLPSWFSSLNSSRRRTRKSTRPSKPRASARPAFFEPLEDRSMLYAVLGIGTGALAGNDLTDVDNNGVEGSYSPPSNLASFDGVFFSSTKPYFGSYEGAFNVFDNRVGGGDDKGLWGFPVSQNQLQPMIVGADFRTTHGPRVLTSFTISSANDTPARDPRVWRIEGSNDTTNGLNGTWTTIYNHSVNSSDWAQRLQVNRYSPANGDTFLTSQAFTAFRMVTTATGVWTMGVPQGNNDLFQLAEIEFFGVSANNPPTVAANAAAVSANEGGTATNSGTFSDPQGNNTVTITASIGAVTQNNAAGTWSWSLNAADGPASGFATITAMDNQGVGARTTFAYSVNNIAPTISLSGNATVNEGSPYTLNLGVITDPGQDTITSYKIHWGDGAIDSFTGNPANTTATHTYADGPNNQSHRVIVTDEDGTVVAGQLSVLVLNVAPTIALTGADTVAEGSPYTLNLGAITDPGADTVVDYSIDWGDGSAVENFTGNPASASKNHVFADGTNPYVISVSLTDEDGIHANAGSFFVMVNNVAPTTPADTNSATNEVTENAASGTLVGITAASTDLGALDTVTYSLTDDAGGRFAIDATTGVVTVASGAQLDYETNTSHSITVEASDGEDTSTQNFTINLRNVTAVISGTVFVDVNGNGLFDGGTETALDGVIVKLLDSALTELAQDVTELGGAYAFTVNDEFSTYVIREMQPTGVTDGVAILGSAAVDSVLSSNEMQVTLAGGNASDYDFTEVGQAVQSGDTATIGFWQNKNGQSLINQGGPALVTWLNTNFGNIFGTTFSNGSGGDNAAEVASFYKNEFFARKLHGTPKVDAQFMATALATFFTSSHLSGGNVAASYGFNVTETGIGMKVVNIGASGAAFGVANNTSMTIMSLLQATNSLTGGNSSGAYRNVYDLNGDGVLNNAELALRVLANTVYTAINENGDI